MDWNGVWQYFLTFCSTWYAKMGIVSGTIAVGQLVAWFVTRRKELHEGSVAKLRAQELRKTKKREENKTSVLDYLRDNPSTVVDKVAAALRMEPNQVEDLLLELKREKRAWSTNRRTWFFGPEPPWIF